LRSAPSSASSCLQINSGHRHLRGETTARSAHRDGWLADSSFRRPDGLRSGSDHPSGVSARGCGFSE